MQGVGSRGVFMFIDGIFLVEVRLPQGSGVKRECRVSGKLYELADVDSIGNDEPYQSASESKAAVVTDKGKGKAKDEKLDLPVSLDGPSGQILSATPLHTSVIANPLSPPASQAGPASMGPSPLRTPLSPNTGTFISISQSAATINTQPTLPGALEPPET